VHGETESFQLVKCRRKWMRRWHWIAITCAILLALLFIGLSYITGGPRNVYPFLRYAPPNWHRGDLRVGDIARDAQLFSLDGQSKFHLRDRFREKPLVLVFGSYT
jgi:hypothetical protein